MTAGHDARDALVWAEARGPAWLPHAAVPELGRWGYVDWDGLTCAATAPPLGAPTVPQLSRCMFRKLLDAPILARCDTEQTAAAQPLLAQFVLGALECNALATAHVHRCIGRFMKPPARTIRLSVA